MSPDVPFAVRLRIDDAPLRRRVETCLADGQADVRLVDFDDSQIDVIIADYVGEHEADTTVGRILLGEGESSRLGVDAVLPVGFLDRELVLACRLVAGMARLRRQLQHGLAARQVLQSQALTDPTTTLPNRRGWQEELTRSLAKCRERSSHLTVAVLDLDHFKRINDTLGHTAGDEVLRRVGAHLAEALRKDDVVARLGGDEFAVLLPGLGPENAETVVERIRQCVSDVGLSDLTPDANPAQTTGVPLLACPAVPSPDKEQTLTASAGYVCVPPEQLADTPDTAPHKTILAAADGAMYEAKDAGRDCTRASQLLR